MAATNKNVLLENVTRFLGRGQLDRAIRELHRIVEMEPDDARARLKLGDTLLRAGRPEEAIAEYERVAMAFSQGGWDQRAVAVYSQILKLAPSRADIRVRLGEHQRHMGLLADALLHFQAAADHFAAHGPIDSLLDVLRRIQTLDPDQPRSRKQIAEVLVRADRVAEAIAELQTLAADLRARSMSQELIPVLERMAQLGENTPSLLSELAQLQLDGGMPRQALATLQTLFARRQDRPVLELLERAFTALGHTDKARRILQEMQRQDGEAMAEVEDAPAVESSFRRQLAEADIYVKYGLVEKALARLRELVGLKPSSEEARLKLAGVLISAGDPEGAAGEWSAVRALRLETGDLGGAEAAEAEVRRLRPTPAARHESASVIEQPAEPAAESHAEEPVVIDCEEEELEEELEQEREQEQELIAEIVEAPSDETNAIVDAASLSDPSAPRPVASTHAPEERRDPAPCAPSAAALPPDLAADLDSADFFVRQAVADYRRILKRVPGHVGIEARLARAAALLEVAAEHPPTAYKAHVKHALELGEIEDLFDGELAEAERADDGEIPLPELVSRFRAGVDTHIGRGDARARYDLGIAFREMGLLDEAIAEFEVAAAADPGRTADCASLIGLCLRDRRDFPLALRAFERAAELALDDGRRASALYEIAETLTLMDEKVRAAEALHQARRLDPNVRGPWGRS